MTQKVHGAAYPGIWVERQVAFVKLTFNQNIAALAANRLHVLGAPGTAAGAGTVADSSFDVVESALGQALKLVETKATVLAISKYDATAFSVDVMLGTSEGWFSNNVGVIASAVPVVGAEARVTTAGAAPTNVVGAMVGVDDNEVTFNVEFVYMDGTMPVATAANGGLATGPGATSGATPTNSSTGTAGFYPV